MHKRSALRWAAPLLLVVTPFCVVSVGSGMAGADGTPACTITGMSDYNEANEATYSTPIEVACTNLATPFAQIQFQPDDGDATTISVYSADYVYGSGPSYANLADFDALITFSSGNWTNPSVTDDSNPNALAFANLSPQTQSMSDSASNGIQTWDPTVATPTDYDGTVTYDDSTPSTTTTVPTTTTTTTTTTIPATTTTLEAITEIQTDADSLTPGLVTAGTIVLGLAIVGILVRFGLGRLRG